MFKARNKKFSLLMALVFAFTMLVPFAGIAGAASTDYSTITAPKVDDGDNKDLGSFLIEIDPLVPGTSEAWVSLPADFDVNGVTISGSNSGVTQNVYEVDGDAGFKIEINNNNGSSVSDASFIVDFTDVDVPDNFSGAIEATIKNISGQLLDGKVTIGYVAGGAVTLTVEDDETFSEEGGSVTIQVEEEVAGTLENGDTIDLVLPDGFEWDENADVSDINILWGDLTAAQLDFSFDKEELSISVDAGVESTQATCFKFTVGINVEDTDDAQYGDVIAKVKGDYDATPDELVVGTYGDFNATVEADDASKQVYAGFDNQEISDIIIKEDLAGSLIDGRTITLKLPENARWAKVDDTDIEDLTAGATNGDVLDTDSGLRLRYGGLQGTDDRTLRLYVDAISGVGSTSDAELKLEGLEVALQAGVTGDLVIEVGGSAGVATEEIKVAEIIAPVTVTAEKKDVVLGMKDQVAGDIIITEAKAGAINEEFDNEPAQIGIFLPDWVKFSEEPDVEVIEGDLKIDDVELAEDDTVLWITIDRDSHEASTIVISNIKYDIVRVLAEGDIDVKIGGGAIVETAFVGYEDEEESYFEDDWYVAEVANATCVTPAPDEKKISTSITLGENGSYISDGRIMVQLRDAATALGVAEQNIFWDNNTKTATFIKGDRVVQITVGDPQVKLNGVALPTDKGAEIKDGRTYVSLSAAGVALGATASWDNTTKTATLTIQ